MLYNGYLTLKQLETGFWVENIFKVMRVKNYEKERISRINSKARFGLRDYYPLYIKKDKQYLFNIGTASICGLVLSPVIKNPINVEVDIQLRDYQVRPMNELLEKPYGLLYADVAFGKTHCIGWIVNKLKCRTVVMTNTQVNAEQMYNRLIMQFGEDKVGLFYGPKKEFKDITVCVYNSYEKLLKKYNGKFDCLIQDECDLLISDNFRELTIITEAQYKYGLTGTPENNMFKKEDFEKRWGRIIDAYEYREQLLKSFDIKVIGVECGKKIDEYNNYNDLKSQLLEDKETIKRIKKIIKHGLENAKKILILTDRKQFTEFLGKELNIPAITGENTKKQRDEILKEFHKKRVLVAIQNIVGRGYDDPDIDMIIIAFSGRSIPRIIQSIGRGLRQKQDKREVIVYDIVNPSHMLKVQWYARKQVYEQFTNYIKFYKLTN